MTLAPPPSIYNSLTHKVDPIPADSPIGLYVCGITPYDAMHLGHAFTYTFFDVLVRYLRFLGHEVKYVQNITDIDDDILRRAGELQVDWKKLGDSEVERFLEGNRRLNNHQPDVMPRATEHIEEMNRINEALLAKGLAYQAGGSVYFEVAKAPQFGRLFPQPYDEMLRVANLNGNYPDDPNKRDPLDFVLWQAWREGEPWWESPWGRGRPGWHIECSAMGIKHLGETFTLHGGGRDLLFPHHDCEIVQSESYTGKQFVKHWLHTGLVRLDGEKMSKSLGNMVFADRLLERFPADALRLYLLARDHRQDWDYEEKGLQAWTEVSARLARLLSDVEETSPPEAFDVASIGVRGSKALLSHFQVGFNLAAATQCLLELAYTNDPTRLRAAKTLATRVFGLTLS